jgi:hypothetical protein
MDKYLVKVFDVFATFIETEAESHDAARSQVEEMVRAGNIQQESFYETTLDPSLWMVMTVDEVETAKKDFAVKYAEFVEAQKKKTEETA